MSHILPLVLCGSLTPSDHSPFLFFAKPNLIDIEEEQSAVEESSFEEHPNRLSLDRLQFGFIPLALKHLFDEMPIFAAISQTKLPSNEDPVEMDDLLLQLQKLRLEMGLLEEKIGSRRAPLIPETILSVEWLYWRAMENGLRYAEIVPQNATNQPKITFIDQPFRWESGVRASLDLSIPDTGWTAGCTWTYLQANPPTVKAASDDHSILAGLALPSFGSSGNSLVNSVAGHWNLIFQTGRLDLSCFWFQRKHVRVIPTLSIQGAKIDQKLKVYYNDYLIQYPTDNTPQTVCWNSKYWGVGPAAEVRAEYVTTSNTAIFLTGSLAGLYGRMGITTDYKNLLNAPDTAKITMKNAQYSLLPVGTLRGGISQTWGQRFELSVSWEEQIWWDQMNLDSFSSFISAPSNSNLTFIGGTLSVKVNF